MKKKIALLISLLFIFQSLSTALGKEVIKAGGVGTGMCSFEALALAYKKKHPEIHLIWAPEMGSNGALKALPDRAIDLAFVAKLPSEDYEKTNNVEHVFYSKTAFVFAVHDEVPYTNLTVADLGKFLRGETTKWSNGKVIRTILRLEAESDTKIVQAISPEINQAVKVALKREGAVIAMSNQESLQTISKTPGAIGFASLTQILTGNSNMRALAYEGKVANLKTLNDGSYPLVKKLYLVKPKNPSPKVKAFIEFMFSKEGRAIIEKTGNSLRESEGKV